MVFGMFMAILDIQIVSASLTEIQAGLAASANEITWVQTAYLIAEVVMIPLSGYLSRALGTRILFAISAGGFTAASLMCGLSTIINEMIFWRAMQGFIGGGMIPTVFATAYIDLPALEAWAWSRRMIGLVATLAPTIGPTVGGYLTDALSWHWLFFINIVPGIVVTAAALAPDRLRQARLVAVPATSTGSACSSMAGFLGALEYVLEEGPRNDWFGDDTVLLLAWVSGLSAVVFFARVLTARQPIVDLRAFTDRNFGLGSLFSFVLGIGLYGLTYLYPLYLGAGPRLQRADDRRDDVRLGRGHVPDRADRRPADGQGRPALHADGRLRVLRRRHLLDDVPDQGLGFLGAVLAAGVPRRRPDDGDGSDQQHRARHAAARAREERLGPLSTSCATSAARSGWRRSPRSSTTAPICTLRACTRPSPGRGSRRWRRSTT